MVKYCIKCGEDINEDSYKEKWCMIITKRGQKIVEFECFHYECWRAFWEGSVSIECRNLDKKRQV